MKPKVRFTFFDFLRNLMIGKLCRRHNHVTTGFLSQDVVALFYVRCCELLHLILIPVLFPFQLLFSKSSLCPQGLFSYSKESPTLRLNFDACPALISKLNINLFYSRMKRKAFLSLVLSIISFASVMANEIVSGQVLDKETKEPIIGATVLLEGTNTGAVTDMDGFFNLNFSRSSVRDLVISYVGYNTEKIKFTNAKTALGEIFLNPASVGMKEVNVVASIVKRDRMTPIALSDIKVDVIENKLGNQEFPSIMKSTPSVYVTNGNGGFGESRISLRGFSSENIGMLINGMPANDMENGKFYWSNWSGLSDVTQQIQIQRGLGASKMGISSVGGTMNIVTKSTDAKEGGSLYTSIGNDGNLKFGFNVSTGLMSNGWAITLAASRNTGDGYVLGSNFEAYTYFANISKTLGQNHRLSFTAFGAPQWHNKRSTMYSIEQYENNQNGRRMNLGYGILNGEITGGAYGYNSYHKPVLSLNHFWSIDETSSLSTVAYASIATGGGRQAYGEGKNWVSINNNTGRPYEQVVAEGDKPNPFYDTKMTSTGLLDFDAVFAANKANGANGSDVVFVNAVNSHNWFGVLSTYNKSLFEKLNLSGGFDGRYYRGRHTQEITDLLGGDVFFDKGKNPLYGTTKETPLKKGDLVGFDSTGEVIWAGLFGQAEYTSDKYSAFLSASLTSQTDRNHVPGLAPVDGKQVSEFVTFLPYSVKGGFNYRFNKYNNAFINGGWFTRAPMFNNVFKNYSVVVNDGAKSEKIGTVELGYEFRNKVLDISVNGYYTQWRDKGLVRRMGDLTANIPGMNAQHMGIEFEATYKPLHNLDIKAMASFGDWTWMNDVEFTLFDENNVNKGTYNAYVKGVHVGNSAQNTAALGINWTPIKNLSVHADWTWFGKNYADFDPNNRKNPKDGVDSWRMPNYSTVDAGMTYRFKFAGLNASIFANAYNIFNTKYIADARDGQDHNAETALVYYGTGTTWATGVRVNF